MTAHVIQRDLDSTGAPATLSSAMVHGLLRQELGFEGVVISDGLGMGALQAFSLEEIVERSVVAGHDLLLFSQNAAADGVSPPVYAEIPALPVRVKHAVCRGLNSGMLRPDALHASLRRVAALKQYLH